MSRKPIENKLNSSEKENAAPIFSVATPTQEMNLTMKEYNNLQREIIFYDNYFSIIN